MKKLVLLTILLFVSFNLNAQEAITSTSNIFLKFTETLDKNNVDGPDAVNILKNELKNLTNFNIVESVDDADFIFELQVTKHMISGRKAKIKITGTLSNKVIFDSKLEKGSPTQYNGFSGTRQAIGRVIKRQILKKYPETSKK